MKNKLTLILLAASVSLTACGGGGGSTAGGGTTTPPVVVPPTTTPGTGGNLQTSVPAPTYAANSDELAAYTEWNAFRSAHGLGLLAQSAALDKAEKNHVAYVVTNNVFAHIEDASKPGFTGVNPYDRALFAGYGSTSVGELGATGHGFFAAKTLENSVYHRSGLMNQTATDAGIAASSSYVAPVFLAYGWTGKGQNNAPDFVTVEPLDKATNVPLSQYPESPNPYIDLTDNNFTAKTTYPLSIHSAAGSTMTVTTFTVTEAGASVPLDTRLLTADTDPYKLLPTNEAYLTGKIAFKANTTYNAVADVSVNGKQVKKSWSFTTGTSIN